MKRKGVVFGTGMGERDLFSGNTKGSRSGWKKVFILSSRKEVIWANRFVF